MGLPLIGRFLSLWNYFLLSSYFFQVRYLYCVEKETKENRSVDWKKENPSVCTHRVLCIPFEGKTSPLSVKLFLDKKQSLLSEIFWPTNKALKWELSYTTIPDVPGTIPFHYPTYRILLPLTSPTKSFEKTIMLPAGRTFQSFDGKELRFHTAT